LKNLAVRAVGKKREAIAMCLSVPGKLLERGDVGGVLVGKVQFGGIVREVCLDLLPEAVVGEYLLVHVGYAISRVDEEEARKSYEYMELAGMLKGELTEFPGDGQAPVIEASPPLDDFELRGAGGETR
jgi:hydrogenase expression/formation protein HypC